MERALNALTILALLGVGALGWWLSTRPAVQPDVHPLEQLPVEVADWRAVRDVPLDATVEAELHADLNLMRLYTSRTLAPVWLYVGYYGTARGGRPQHTPRGCYLGAGWAIRQTRVVDVGPELRVNEYQVERDGQLDLVHFWYRSHRRTGMLGGIDQNLDRIVGRLVHGRADGALVRLSTPVPAGGEVQARGQLMAFAAALDPLLAEHWPLERPRR